MHDALATELGELLTVCWVQVCASLEPDCPAIDALRAWLGQIKTVPVVGEAVTACCWQASQLKQEESCQMELSASLYALLRLDEALTAFEAALNHNVPLHVAMEHHQVD